MCNVHHYYYILHARYCYQYGTDILSSSLFAFLFRSRSLLAIAKGAEVDIEATRVQIADIPSLRHEPTCAASLNSAVQHVRAALDTIPPPSADDSEEEGPDGGAPIHHWSVHELDELDLEATRAKVEAAAAAVREMGVEFEARIASERREIARLRDELPRMQRRLMASTTMADVSGLGRIPVVSRSLAQATRLVDAAQAVLEPESSDGPPGATRVNIEDISRALSALEATIEDERDRRRQEESERRRRDEEQRAEQRRLIEAEHARLRMADERRKHGLAKLDPAVHRLAELTASAEVRWALRWALRPLCAHPPGRAAAQRSRAHPHSTPSRPPLSIATGARPPQGWERRRSAARGGDRGGVCSGARHQRRRERRDSGGGRAAAR